MNFQTFLNFLLSIAPQLEAAVFAVSNAKGLPVDHPDVAAAVAQHLTPGQPNITELNG
jgi:hypothetical protein